MKAAVVQVSRSGVHRFSKANVMTIRLVPNCGVEGDAHFGEKVQHLSRVRADPTQPNLRQVHLIHSELFEELRAQGFDVSAGEMGENITTRGIDLLGLPTGARLRIGSRAVVEVTGLRNPCVQIDRFRQGLVEAVLGRDADGNLVRKAGIMGIVVEGDDVMPGDEIRVDLPPEPHIRLERV